MNWFQKFLSAIALVNMVVSPVFAGNWTSQEKAQLAQYREYLEPLGYTLTLDNAAKKALVYDKATSKLTMEIPFSDETHLRKFSPKALNRMMLDEMVRIKSSSKAAWSHSVRNLPTESAIFFVAMGAVIAGQLITNYSQNPVAMKQHIDHSMSPIGVFGFFTFMYSQGVTSNILAMYMKNPNFHHMIPYLGMTVGAFLQTYLTQIVSDPNVKACAKTMMGSELTDKDRASGIDEDPCSKAYEYLVLQKKIWEFAPGIVSMLISSGIAGVAQSVLSKAVLRMTGVDIALWLVPGSMQLKGFRLLLIKGLQITAFVAIDVWLNRKVVSAWKNFFDGAEFTEINKNLESLVNNQKNSQWSNSDGLLKSELKTFQKKMIDWRMMNLAEVYEAHQNWSQALQQLTSMHNTSQSFYSNFIAELRNSRFQEADLRRLERPYPYAGIKASGLAEGKEDLYFTNPQFVESMQEDTINESVVAAEAFLKTDLGQHLYPQEKKQIQDLLANLRSADMNKKIEGLNGLNKSIEVSMQNVTSSVVYRNLLRDLYKSMGSPQPMMEIGRGYLATYEKSPTAGEALKNAGYYRQVGLMQTPQITDYLVMQMLCGPDVEKNEKVIRNSTGFPSVFLPPTIKNSSHDLNICVSAGAKALNKDMIYKIPLRVGEKQIYKGAVDYLIHESRDSVMGTKSEIKFDNWWKTGTEKEMQVAFEAFGKEYDNIVSKMVELIYRQDRSRLNRGPIHNGAMNAAFQEERVYLSILQDLMRPSSNYKLDIKNILSQPVEIDSLKKIEHQFAIMNGLIKKIKVEEVEGRKVISSPLENYELEEQLTNIQNALKEVSEQIGIGDSDKSAKISTSSLNKQQRDIAVDCMEHLQSLATEIMMYGTMANAVSWDKIRNLKRLNMEQQKFNNEIQAKLAAMRGLNMPGKP